MTRFHAVVLAQKNELAVYHRIHTMFRPLPGRNRHRDLLPRMRYTIVHTTMDFPLRFGTDIPRKMDLNGGSETTVCFRAVRSSSQSTKNSKMQLGNIAILYITHTVIAVVVLSTHYDVQYSRVLQILKGGDSCRVPVRLRQWR
jgi:hypothetical protein